MELKRILNILRRRKWFFLQAVIVIPFVTIFISLRLPNVYETSAKILVKPSETESSSLSSLGFTTGMSGSDSSLAMESRIELLQVDAHLNSAIERLQLRDSGGRLMSTKKILKAPPIVSSIFPAPYVKFQQLSDTDIIEITTRSTDPEEAAMMATVLAESYIEDALSERKKEYTQARAFIEAQLSLVKSQYLQAAEEIKNFRIEHKTVDLEDETRSAIDHMESLLKEKERIVRAGAETKARTSELVVQLKMNTGERASGAVMNQNPQVALLKRTIGELDLELAAAGSEKTDEHPDVIVLKDQLVRAKSEMAAELALFNETSSDLQGFERDLAALEGELTEVNKGIEAQEKILIAIPTKAYGESELALTYQLSQQLYGTLLEHFYELGVAEAMLPADTRLIETAVIPDIDRPDSPRVKFNAVVSVILAIMLGMALAFIVEYLDDTVKRPADIRELGLRLLGMVPKFSVKGKRSIANLKPTHPTTEAYRTIRAGISFATLDNPAKSILVTSSWSEEGKTTTAMNLAISYATSGSKVLVLDADFRKPALHAAFEMPMTPGLTEVLTGDIPVDDVIRESETKNLAVVTCGNLPLDPAGVVESEQMRSIIDEFKGRYDMVIIDSPPVGAGTDSAVLAQYADTSILVARASRTTQAGIAHASETLSQVNADVGGVVFNRFKHKSHGGYYYGPYSDHT